MSSSRGIWRTVAVSGSCVLFALAVLQAQQGCDRREPPPEATSAPAIVDAPASAPAAAAMPASAPVQPTTVAAPAAEPAATPELAKPKPEPKPEPKPKPKEREFFPATKSGGMHVLERPAANPPVQQQAGG
jgi:hypothetical protein